jgi:translocator protein
MRIGRYEWIGIFTCFSLGILSGMSVSVGDSSWYMHLNKPSFTPPNWIFGPVWSIIYILMGIAAGKIWQNHSILQRVLFISQFILNLLWSPIFFYYHQILFAFLELCMLWMFLLVLLFTVKKQTKIYILLIPYLIWVSFAGFLNYTIWLLNG